jgi:hypothetical protein
MSFLARDWMMNNYRWPVRTAPTHRADRIVGGADQAIVDARIRLWTDLWRDAAAVSLLREALPGLRRDIVQYHRDRALATLDRVERTLARSP